MRTWFGCIIQYSALILVASLACSTQAVRDTSAATVTSLNDNFNSEGASLNYNSFANWNVTAGSVDVVNGSSNPWGIVCAGGCVDTDGTTSAAGTLQTKDSFAPGAYTLSFDISGNQRGGVADSLLVNFGTYSETFLKNASDPFEHITRNVTLSAIAALIFSGQGGDNVGILLDNVAVRTLQNPLPGALFLFATGLGALGLLGWRRKRKNALAMAA
jgi:hypothetical protein